MGQSIDVQFPLFAKVSEIDALGDADAVQQHVASKVEAYEARLRKRTHRSWSIAWQAYEPKTPNPDDADPDQLVGFYVCRGDNDDAGSHQLPAMTITEMRRTEPTASIIRRCRRRWSRFARWARKLGVEFGKARIWRTRTEVA